MSRELVEIVDDNADVRLFVRTSLEDEGFRVVEAHDGVSAMEVFDSEKPAVVILDGALGMKTFIRFWMVGLLKDLIST